MDGIQEVFRSSLGPLTIMRPAEIDELRRFGVELHGLSAKLEPFEQWVLEATPLLYGEWLAADGPSRPPSCMDYVKR